MKNRRILYEKWKNLLNEIGMSTSYQTFNNAVLLMHEYRKKKEKRKIALYVIFENLKERLEKDIFEIEPTQCDLDKTLAELFLGKVWKKYLENFNLSRLEDKIDVAFSELSTRKLSFAEYLRKVSREIELDDKYYAEKQKYQSRGEIVAEKFGGRIVEHLPRIFKLKGNLAKIIEKCGDKEITEKYNALDDPRYLAAFLIYHIADHNNARSIKLEKNTADNIKKISEKYVEKIGHRNFFKYLSEEIK